MKMQELYESLLQNSRLSAEIALDLLNSGVDVAPSKQKLRDSVGRKVRIASAAITAALVEVSKGIEEVKKYNSVSSASLPTLPLEEVKVDGKKK